jgi:hypothetical protein
MYFFHYALDNNIVEKMREEVNLAVKETKFYVDDSIYNISTTKGSQYHLNDERSIKYLEVTLSKLSEIVRHSLNPKNACVSSAWTVYGKKGSFHTVHRHNDLADICTVVYLDVEKEKNPEKYGAFFYFIDGDCKTHHPMTGDVLIFPATMWHGTYPQDADNRHTLNIDFSHEINIQQ